MRAAHGDRTAPQGPASGAGRSTSGRGPRPAPAAGGPGQDGITDDDLRGFLEMPTELFAVFDPGPRTAWCSPGVASTLGYRPDELNDRGRPVVIQLEDRIEPTDDGEAAAGLPLTHVIRCRAHDGSWRRLEWSGAWDEDSGRWLGAARDVTARHHAEETARANERMVEGILDHSTAAIFVKDTDGRFTLVNDAFLRVHGLERDAVVGRTAAEVWGAGDAGADEVEPGVIAGRAASVTDDVVESGGGRHVFMTVRFPLLRADGTVSGVAGIATDVTERTEAERALAERERVLDTIFRACPDIVSILDPGGRLRELGQASARILGFPIGAPSGLQIQELLHPDDAGAVSEAFAQLLSLQRLEVDVRARVRHRDGHWVTLDTRARALVSEDGRGAGAVVVSRDVSADLAFERQLQEAVTEAERASTAKSAFLSRMSHQLRTPLNSVLGFAQLLELEQLGEQQHEAVRHVIRAGRHLSGLIDEVLDIARIEAGQVGLSLGPTPLNSVIADAVDLTRPLAEDRHVALTVDAIDGPEDVFVLADDQRLLQVLLNLLSNGVKYNHEGGAVVVAARARADRIDVVVADTGPGIDPGDMHRVFAPFDRLGADRGGVPGTGVGLALSKRLVEEMGGTISVESRPGEGAVFTVSLMTVPSSGPAPARSVTIRRDPSVAGSLRVLHIEDNQANLELVEQVLSRVAGVDLQAAMTGGLGLEMAKDNPPDLVLLDVHLPDLSGPEVLARLRSNPATSEIPVVVVSADATPTTVHQLRSDGVLAYLSKPIDVHELLRIAESLTVGGVR